jgi:hypothetical protein
MSASGDVHETYNNFGNANLNKENEVNGNHDVTLSKHKTTTPTTLPQHAKTFGEVSKKRKLTDEEEEDSEMTVRGIYVW